MTLFAVVSFFAVGCAPSASQLQKVLEENPDVLVNAIKKNPKKFMDAVQEASVLAKKQGQEDEIKEIETGMQAQFKEPLKPKLEGRPVFGPESAKITIVEYSDFLCYYCMKADETIKQLKEDYKDNIKVILKHLPFRGPSSKTTALYFESIASRDKAKAWKFHDLLFENQKDLRDEAVIKKLAKKAGANVAQIEADIKAKKFDKFIEEDLEEGKEFGATGTPAFIVNGVFMGGLFPTPMFKKVIDHHLSGKDGKDFKIMD